MAVIVCDMEQCVYQLENEYSCLRCVQARPIGLRKGKKQIDFSVISLTVILVFDFNRDCDLNRTQKNRPIARLLRQ